MPRTSRERARRLLANLGLAALSLVVSAAAAELALRAWGYRFSPIQFLTPENTNDWRAFHMGANDPRLSLREPLTVFDPALLWRVNPAGSRDINEQGFRGPLFPEPAGPGDVIIAAVGDSNTLGPLHVNDHWPGFLDDLVRQDRSRSVRVVNAGVYGYTALQGMRLLPQVLRYRPDVVLFSFGANDAQPVATTDAAYADRVAWLRRWDWSRIAPPLAHLWQKATDSWQAPSPPTHRVPLADYRRHLEAFVAETRAAGALPVLLTRPWVGRSDDPASWMTHAPLYDEATRAVAADRGVALVDAHAEFHDCPDLFVDPMHFNRLGNRRMAGLVLERLTSLGIVHGVAGFVPGPVIELAQPDERRPELGQGFWSVELPDDGPPGRWTAATGTITLGRTRGERGLVLDLSNRIPLSLRVGRVEVNGRTLFDFRERRGRMRPTLDIGDIHGPTLEVRFVTDPPYVPQDHEIGSPDVRALGVFVHAARLIDAPYAAGVDLADLDQDSPELGEGWFGVETWSDGRRGRWTGPVADLVLERRASEDRVVIDASFENRRNRTAGTVEIDGGAAARFRAGNSRRQETVTLPSGTGRRLRIRFRIDDPYVAARHEPGNPDTRALGLFVHSVRLVDAAQPRTSSQSREPSGQGQDPARR